MKRYLKLGLLAAVALAVGFSGALSASSSPRIDQLATVNWWQFKVKTQVASSVGHRYAGCLFGDSISSALGNTIGPATYNFAMGGMSTVSLLEQLKQLRAGGVQCQKAVIAIGTNDAMYAISDTTFKNNLRQIVTLARGLGANEITLIPAFYSTIPASEDPNMAGTIDRVDQISTLIRQVGIEQDVRVLAVESLQPLYRDRSLKEELTLDGVHLNDGGKKIYRQLLLGIFDSAVSSR